MSAESNLKDVYLFEIDNDASGFAEFVRVHLRHPPTTHAQALNEINEPKLPTEWCDVTGMHAAGGLDMRFAAFCEALVFVRLPYQGGLTETEFGDDVVEDLKVKGGKPKNIIRGAQHYPPRDGMRLLCSFELNLPLTLAAMPRAPLSHKITRLPIMFDFVDRGDKISPAFKDPRRYAISHSVDDAHEHDHDLDDKDKPAPLRGHGGIHPRGGSSLILVA